MGRVYRIGCILLALMLLAGTPVTAAASSHEFYAAQELAAMQAKLRLVEVQYNIEEELAKLGPFERFWTASALAESYAIGGDVWTFGGYSGQAWYYWGEAFSCLVYLNDTGWGSTWGVPLAANHFIVASALLGARWESVQYQIKRAYDEMVEEFPMPLTQTDPADSKAEENAWRAAFYLLADAFTRGGPYATNSYWRGDFFVGHIFTFERGHNTTYFNEEFSEDNLAGFWTTNQGVDPLSVWPLSPATYNHSAVWPAPNYALGGDSAGGELLHGLLAYGPTPAYLQMRNLLAVDTPTRHYINARTGYYTNMAAHPYFGRVAGGWVSEWGDSAQYCTSGIALGIMVAEKIGPGWVGRMTGIYEGLLDSCLREPLLTIPQGRPDTQFLVDCLLAASHAKAHLAWAGWTV